MSLLKSSALFLEAASPIFVDCSDDRKLYQNDMHRHEFFEMIYVERGTLTNRFKNSEITLEAGDILILKPYVLHLLLDNPKQSQSKAYLCSFLTQAVDSGSQALEGLDAHSPYSYFFHSFQALADNEVSAVQIKMPSGRRSMLNELFKQLKVSSHEKSARGMAVARFHFLKLLLVLAEEEERNQGKGGALKIVKSVTITRYKGGFRKTLQYMHDHFQEPLSLGKMAAMSGASSTYFCRLFKHETGTTFLNYLISLRIERAGVLLRDTSESAIEICYKVGFNDYAHFGRQFKKHMGMSPVEFRRQDTNIQGIRDV